ncbi:MAG TPA: cobalt ECF transporter T component CbiQ [Candidatus Methanoperedens sp.]
MADSRVKLFASFFIIISLTLMKHWYFPVIASALCIVISLKLGIIRDYLKQLIFPLVMALFILAVQSFTYGETVMPGIIPVYAEGFNYGLLIFSRVFASASVLVLLIKTTSEKEVLEGMRWFRIPQTMLEISSFMMRYMKSFSREGKQIKLAMESRCGFGRKRGFKGNVHNTASICGALVSRAFARSDDVYSAMVSRGWKPGLKYPVDFPPLDKNDIMMGIALIAGMVSLIAIDSFA